MNVGAAILGLARLVIAIIDAFQTVVVARHAHKLPMLTRLFYQLTWTPFASAMARVRPEEQRRSQPSTEIMNPRVGAVLHDAKGAVPDGV